MSSVGGLAWGLGLVLMVIPMIWLDLWEWYDEGTRVPLGLASTRRRRWAVRADHWGMSICWTVLSLSSAMPGEISLSAVKVGWACGLVSILAWFTTPSSGSRRGGLLPEVLPAWWGEPIERARGLRQKVGKVDSCQFQVLSDEAEVALADSASLSDQLCIPQRLLTWMNRTEIDALIAYQIAWARTQAYAIGVRMGLGFGGLVMIGVFVLLHLDPQRMWHIALALLPAEMVGLAIFLPRLRRRTDLKAIALCGDPEAYVSAVVELSRLRTGTVDQWLARRLGRVAGLTRGRVRELQNQPRPALHRYAASADEFDA